MMSTELDTPANPPNQPTTKIDVSVLTRERLNRVVSYLSFVKGTRYNQDRALAHILTEFEKTMPGGSSE